MLELFGASRDFSNKDFLEFNIDKIIEIKAGKSSLTNRAKNTMIEHRDVKSSFANRTKNKKMKIERSMQRSSQMLQVASNISKSPR